MSEAGADLHLRLAPDPERLAEVAGAIEDLGEREQWSPEFLFRMNLVLEEMTLNVMTHGRSAGASELEVVVTCDADTVSIEITDDGPRFDPLSDLRNRTPARRSKTGRWAAWASTWCGR